MRHNHIFQSLASLLLSLSLTAGIPSVVAYAQDADGQGDIAEAAALPEKFDLRDKGVVSPVKNQAPWGSCWAFGALAASETSILSELGTTYDASPLDFSVRDLAWFAGTALPDQQTMEATGSLAPYASQATEGLTVLPGMENVHAHPLESGGSAFYAVTVLASGVGPVSDESVPYRNEENIAEYLCNPDEDTEFIGHLGAGQTLQEFLAEHSGIEYLGFAQEMVYDNPLDEGLEGDNESGDTATDGDSASDSPADNSSDGSESDGGSDINENGTDDEGIPEEEDGPYYGPVRSARVEVTPELAASGKLANYSAEPIFDKDGHFIQIPDESTPIYDWSVPEEKRFERQYELEESNALPQPTGGYAGQTYRYDEEATLAIKRELLAGRGVTITLYDDSGTRTDEDGKRSMFTNRETWSQYVASDDGTIHGAAHNVCIVGWDDTWPVEEFDTLSGITPPGPGCWIIKNSYGAETAAFPNTGNIGYPDESGKRSGYMRVSYYDMSLWNPTSFDYDASGHVSDHIYQYDFMTAPIQHTEKSSDETKCANVFTAERDQSVHALSVETEDPNTHARLELWLLDKGATDPTTGTCVATVEKDLAWGGYHRISLDDACLVKAGQRFSVVATLTTSDSNGTTYHVPVHRDVNESSIEKYGESVTTYVTGVINPGESFLMKDGSWKDWSDVVALGKAYGVRLEAQSDDDPNETAPEHEGALNPYYDYDNLSLKAFADDVPEEESQQEPEPKEDDEPEDTKPAKDETKDKTPQQTESEESKSTQTGNTSKAKTLPRTDDPLSEVPLVAMLVAGLGFLVAGIFFRRHKR